MSEKHELDSNVFDIHSHQLNEKDHGIAQEELYPEANDSMTCWQKVKNAWNNFVNRTIDYFQYDRVFNAEGQPQIDLKKCYKRFLENYDETYSEREMRFAFSFDYVLQEKIKEEQKKEKNFLTELYRFVCCEGGNEMEEIDEAYKSEREYQQIIKKKLLEKKEVFQEMMRKEAEEEKEKEREKEKEQEKERQKENEKLKEIINNDSLQLYDEEQEKKEISRKKRTQEAIPINTKILKVSQTEQHIISSENIDNVSDRTHKKGDANKNPNSNTYHHEHFDEEIHNTKSNKYAKTFNSNGQSNKKVTTTYTTEENLITRNTYEENHVFNNFTHEERQAKSLKKKNNIQGDFQEDETEESKESKNRMQRRKKLNEDDVAANNTNSSTTKQLATKDPVHIGSNQEQEGAYSRKYNRNPDKVSSANPNMEEYNTNPYANQGYPNKNASFIPSNDPNNISNRNNLKLSVVETDITKDKNIRYDENEPNSNKKKRNNKSNNRADEEFDDYGVPVDSKKKEQTSFNYNFDEPNNQEIGSAGAKGSQKLGNSNNSDQPISNTYNQSYSTKGKHGQNSSSNDPNLYMSEANNSPTVNARRNEREITRDPQSFVAQPFDFDQLENSNGQNFKKNKQNTNTNAKASHTQSSPYKNSQYQGSDPNYNETAKARNNRSPGKLQNNEQSRKYKASPPKNNKNQLTQNLNQQFDEPVEDKHYRGNFKDHSEELSEQSSSAAKKRKNKRSNHPQQEDPQDSYEQEQQRNNNRTRNGEQQNTYQGIKSKKEKKIKQAKPSVEEQQHEIIFEDDTNDYSKQPISNLQNSEEVSPQQAHKKRKVKKMVVNDNMEEEINLQDFSMEAKNDKEYSKTVGVKEGEAIVQASKKRRNKKQLRNNDDQMNVQEVVFDALQGIDLSQAKNQPNNQGGSLVKAEKKRKRVKPRREDEEQQEEIIEINF